MNHLTVIKLIRLIYEAMWRCGARRIKGRNYSSRNHVSIEFDLRHSKDKIHLSFTTFKRNDEETLKIKVVKNEEQIEIATKMVEHVSIEWLKEKIKMALDKAKKR